MKDAKSTEAESQHTTQTNPIHEHPLNETIEETSIEPPPKYSNPYTAHTDATPTNQAAQSVPPVTYMGGQQFGNAPVTCSCPSCHQNIITRVEETSGPIIWAICILILLLGGWFGCCLIPFCISDLKDKTHYCPNCGTVVAKKTLL